MEISKPGGLPDRNLKSGKQKYPSHRLKKRGSATLPKRENDIYVSNRSNVQCQISKCQKLFDNGFSEIVIHGLGAAINTAVNLSLILQEKLSHTVDIAVNTSTVDFLDDFLPLEDDGEPFSRKRSNSAIHVRVYRKANL